MTDDEALAALRKFAPWAFGDNSGPPGFDHSATYTHLETPEESEARVQQWRCERGLDDLPVDPAPPASEELRQFHLQRMLALQQEAVRSALDGREIESFEDLERATAAMDAVLLDYCFALGESADGVTLDLAPTTAELLRKDRERQN